MKTCHCRFLSGPLWLDKMCTGPLLYNQQSALDCYIWVLTTSVDLEALSESLQCHFVMHVSMQCDTSQSQPSQFTRVWYMYRQWMHYIKVQISDMLLFSAGYLLFPCVVQFSYHTPFLISGDH